MFHACVQRFDGMDEKIFGGELNRALHAGQYTGKAPLAGFKPLSLNVLTATSPREIKNPPFTFKPHQTSVLPNHAKCAQSQARKGGNLCLGISTNTSWACAKVGWSGLATAPSPWGQVVAPTPCIRIWLQQDPTRHRQVKKMAWSPQEWASKPTH